MKMNLSSLYRSQDVSPKHRTDVTAVPRNNSYHSPVSWSLDLYAATARLRVQHRNESAIRLRLQERHTSSR